MATSTIKRMVNPADVDALNGKIAEIYHRGDIVFWGVYPNGRQNNTFKVLVPGYNPKLNAGTIVEAYVYDSAGNWTDIKSGLAIATKWSGYEISGTFNSAHAGKLLRIDVYTS